MSLNALKKPSWNDQFKSTNQRDFKIQVVISLVFGLSAFLSFCVNTTNLLATSFNADIVRCFDQDGPASIMPARSNQAQLQGFQTCPSRCSDGYL